MNPGDSVWAIIQGQWRRVFYKRPYAVDDCVVVGYRKDGSGPDYVVSVEDVEPRAKGEFLAPASRLHETF